MQPFPSGRQANQTTIRIRQFVNQYSTLFGIRDASDLRLIKEEDDRSTNGHHVTYRQYHQGVPVFGGMLKTHFDETGAMRSVNGMTVPNIALNMKPGISAQRAAQIAAAKVNLELNPKIRRNRHGHGSIRLPAGIE